MTAKDLFEQGNEWTDNRTRLALPILLAQAKRGSNFTYEELNQAVADRWDVKRSMALNYRHVLYKTGNMLGFLSDEWGIEIPPLGVLAVNEQTRLPGDGFEQFLERYLEKSNQESLSDNNREAMLQRATEAVFNFPRWNAVAAYFDVEPEDHLPEHVAIGLPSPSAVRGGGGEGAAHLALKSYVADHPELFRKYGDFPLGETEQTLLSGDVVDVLFRNRDQALAVEVKAADAPPGELTRGIFQCVKYRAVLRAMHDVAGELVKVEAVLATPQTIVGDHKAAADRLAVPIVQVKVKS